jgi:hypothetical protein
MNLLEIVKKTYPEAHKVQIYQRFENKFGWHTYKNLPDLTVDKLVKLHLSGHTMVSLKITAKDGWKIADASDYAIKEFFPKKSLTLKHPTDNRHITLTF